MTNEDLWGCWDRGEYHVVAEFLATANPARTAVFIVQGSCDRRLTAEDCNRVTNLLIEHMQAKLESHVPNLDVMEADELEAFAAKLSGGNAGRAAARELFPGRPTGYFKAAGDVRSYASFKALATRQRERGKIQAAADYERVCDTIYKRLPEFARW